MSNVRNFCISINLCLWFNDHRHKARIFINDNILTISDLERRIEDIFKIKNLYLTSQNEYLPSSEDIRILQPNDVVWVMRNNCEQETLPNTIPEVVTANPENVIINRKRSISQTQDSTEQDTHPVKKKKKKKHELVERRYIKDASPPKAEPKKKKKQKVDENSSLQDQVRAKIDKKVKNVLSNNSNDSVTSITSEDSCSQDKNGSMNITKLLPVLHSHIKSYNNKVSKRANESEAASTFLKTPSPLLTTLGNSYSQSYKDSQQVYTCKGILQAAHEKKESPKLGSSQSASDKDSQKVCKGTLKYYKKKYSVPTITDEYLQKKKVNLVKIEYLSREPTLDFAEKKETITYGDQDNAAYSTYSSNLKNGDSGIDYNSIAVTPENNCVNQENPVGQSMTKLKQSEIFLTEKNGDSNQSNTAVTNERKEPPKGLNNTISEEAMEVTESEPQSFKQLNMSDNLATSTMKSPLLSQDKEYTSLDTANEVINKSDPVCKTDISFDRTKFKSGSCDAVPNISNNQTEVKAVNIVKVLSNSRSKVDNLANYQNLETTSCDVSKNVSSAITNNNSAMENVSKELHIDEFNGTAEISQKESTEGPILFTETMNANDNKILDIDLTEDVTNSLLDDSIQSCGTRPIYLKRKQLSGIGQLLEELRTNESLVTGESMDSDHSEFVTKRSRKRIRKRKKKNNEINNTSFSDSSFVENSDYVPKPKPIKTRACPTIHLKFEEDAEHLLKVVDVNKKSDGTRANNESNMETSGIENITIESDVEQSNVENFTIKEEYILKSPSIKNSLPKMGDIIAFKILRIENYTPEVSSYIIGKVIDFNHDSKVVLYDILNGIELIPEETDQNCDSHKREFMWTDIIDPRLLFP